MVVIHEIKQVIWLDSPKGLVLAKFLIDRGPDSDFEWVTFHQETGAILSFDNSDVLAHKNYTLNRRIGWSDFELPRKPTRRGVPNSMGRMLRMKDQ